MVIKTQYGFESKRKLREAFANFIRKHYPTKFERKDQEVAFLPGYDEHSKTSLEVIQVYDQLKIKRKNLTGIERSKKIYKKLERADLGINLFYGDDLEFFQSTNKKFDVISLDYTGMFELNTNRVLSIIFSKQILKNKGILFINCYGARESNIVKSLYEIPYYHLYKLVNIQGSGKLNYDKFKEKIEKELSLRKTRDKGMTDLIREKAEAGKELLEDFTPSIIKTSPSFISSCEEFYKKLKEMNIWDLKSEDGISADEEMFKKYIKSSDALDTKILYDRIMLWKEVEQMYEPSLAFMLCTYLIHKESYPYYTDDMELYKYISDTGSPMFGNIFYFNQHREWFDERKYPIIVKPNENGIREIILERDKKKTLLHIENMFIHQIKNEIRFSNTQRTDLGSSYKPKATKEKLREELLAGTPKEEIIKKFRDVNPRTLAAIKAHITMGTYNKEN